MGKQVFDYYGFPCDPRDIDKNNWFYVQKEGLVLVRRHPSGIPTEQLILPWSAMKRALDDREKAPERRERVRKMIKRS